MTKTPQVREQAPDFELAGTEGRLRTQTSVIVIDEQGVVCNRHDDPLGLDRQSVGELKSMPDALPVAAT